MSSSGSVTFCSRTPDGICDSHYGKPSLKSQDDRRDTYSTELECQLDMWKQGDDLKLHRFWAWSSILLTTYNRFVDDHYLYVITLTTNDHGDTVHLIVS